MPTRTLNHPLTHARGAPQPPALICQSGPHENTPYPNPDHHPGSDPSRPNSDPSITTNPEEKEMEEKEEEEENWEVDEEAEKRKISKLTRRITLHPTLTPHQRKTYLALLCVPRGRWTTYSALAQEVHSSARAVGNAMRSNPFAPEVPCHRVLAVDGSLGGYKGEPPSNNKLININKSAKGGKGKRLEEKRGILEREGVRFDAGGRALGGVFVDFPATTASLTSKP